MENLPNGTRLGNYAHTLTLGHVQADIVDTAGGITIGGTREQLNVACSGVHWSHVDVEGGLGEKHTGTTIATLTGNLNSEGVTRSTIGDDEVIAIADKLEAEALAKNSRRPLPQVAPPETEFITQQRLSQPSVAEQIGEIGNSHQGAIVSHMVTGNAVLGDNIVVVAAGNENRTGQEIRGNVTTGPTNVHVIQTPGARGNTVGIRVQGDYTTHQDMNITIGGGGNCFSDYSSDSD